MSRSMFKKGETTATSPKFLVGQCMHIEKALLLVAYSAEILAKSADASTCAFNVGLEKNDIVSSYACVLDEPS